MKIMNKYLLSTAICRAPDDGASAVNEILEAAEEVAEDAIEAAEEAAEDAIELAAERVEAAEAAAQAITDAALMTALGNRITETAERAETWHGEQLRELETLRGMVQEQERQITGLREVVTALQTPTVVVTKPEPETSSILPTLAPEPTAVAVITPGASVQSENTPVAEAVARRKTRWI